MLPPLAEFPIEIVTDVLSEHGIHPIQDFPDGQMMWGTEPITMPYRGKFTMADFSSPGKYSMVTVRVIANMCDKAGEIDRIEEAIRRISEERRHGRN